MDDQFIESRKAVAKAREAMRLGDHAEARIWAERAAELAPGTEDPWLLLAALASPYDSLDYLKRAFAINPNSARARKGMQWAKERLSQTPEAHNGSLTGTQPLRPARSASSSIRAQQNSSNRTRRKRRSPIFPVLIFTLGCVVVAFAAWSASSSPALASILSLGGVTQPPPDAHPLSWARAEIAKPTYTLMPMSLLPAATATATLPALPTDDTVPLSSETSFPPVVEAPVIGESVAGLDPALPNAIHIPDHPSVAEDVPTIDAGPTATPGTMYAEIVPDTPTSAYVAPTAAAFEPAPVPSGGYGEHWIDVDLSQQRVYAYEGDSVVNSFIVSTGTWQTPTVTGRYKVWIKLRSTTMAGPGYYLPNVPWVMYFYKGYGFHGTYWHNNFGTPMSHGCVNLSIPDAEWLYNFASEGTVVNVHY